MSVPADRPPHLPDLKRHSWRAVRALLAVAVAFARVVPQASAAAAMSRVSAAGPGEHDTAPTWVSNSRLAFQRRIPGSISCNVATLHTIDTDGTGDLAGPSFYPWPYKFLPGTGRVAYIPNSPACAGPFPTYYQVVTSELDGSDVHDCRGTAVVQQHPLPVGRLA